MSWSPAFRRGYHYYDEKRKKRRALNTGGGVPSGAIALRIFTQTGSTMPLRVMRSDGGSTQALGKKAA